MSELDMEMIQLYRNADEADKKVIFDMLFCFAYCDEDFMSEIQDAKSKGRDAIKTVVAKYVEPLNQQAPHERNAYCISSQ